MAITDEDVALAEARRPAGPRATSARYDVGTARIVVQLDSGLELAFPSGQAEGLEAAGIEDLSVIEISPTGMGLHWPRLDADLYLPGLLQGIFGSPRWMAAQMGRLGGQSKTDAKAAAAQSNGRLGGRPRRTAKASVIG